MVELVVVAAFADFAVGDRITDGAQVDEHLHSANVVRVTTPDAAFCPAPVIADAAAPTFDQER